MRSFLVTVVLARVRDRIVELFGVTPDEATARIEAEFAGIDLRDPWNERYLCSEGADYWAKSVMYGLDVAWWHQDDPEIRPMPPAAVCH